MDFLWLITAIGIALWAWGGINLIKRYRKIMFVGNQWHIPTSREGRETIEVRHEDLSELQWLEKKLPDRAFHAVYEDNTDQAIVYHRTSKEG